MCLHAYVCTNIGIYYIYIYIHIYIYIYMDVYLYIFTYVYNSYSVHVPPSTTWDMVLRGDDVRPDGVASSQWLYCYYLYNL